MRGVARMIRAAARRRRLQTLVVGLVSLLSTATVVLAVGLLVLSSRPFDRAFAGQAGAHAAANFDPAVGVDALRATGTRPGVTAAAGPFDTTTATVVAGPWHLGPLTVVGRADAGGPVDRLTVTGGRWLSGPGEIVLDRLGGGREGIGIGDSIAIGAARLRIVGYAASVTGTADAWVWPGQSDVLHATGAQGSRQMLYRFASAGSDAAVAASLATATADLPQGSLLGSSSYLVTKRDSEGSSAPTVPFVVAFAVLGLVLSVLIVANVVSGAVVAGYRTIGVLKSLGFAPGQVVAVYTGQVLLPGVLGCVFGVLLGDLLAVPVLAQTDRAYAVASTGGVTAWVDVLAVLGLPAVIALSAIVPATRAGRLPAAQAISIGRAPRTGGGRRVRRALGHLRLPVPVRFGLATPFARPARTAGTLVAILLGALTVVFAAGLGTSLHRVAVDADRTAQVPVEVDLEVAGLKRGGTPEIIGADPATVEAAIDAQPGTAHEVGVADADLTLVGYNQSITVQAYRGDSAWLGYAVISGRWYAAPDEVVLDSQLLRTTGHRVGDTVTVAGDSGRRPVRVVGEVFDLDRRGLMMHADTALLGALAPSQPVRQFEVGLRPGTNVHGYVDALSATLGSGAEVSARDDSERARTLAVLTSLAVTLALLLCTVAALGVFNTVVLNTRERVHEIGVLKTLGMTPRQVRLTVVSSVAAVGLLAGVLATPLGALLHHRVLPVMGSSAGTAVPSNLVHVYRPAELVALALAGVLLAVFGALVPAGWAAGTRIATALRAE